MPEITQELIANVANRRARGRSWEAISIEFAEVFPGDPDTLRNAMWREPEFERYCDIAEKDLAREGEAEMMILFRNRMRSKDEDVALKAAMALAKHLASKAREATRIEVERMRSNTAIAKMKLRVEKESGSSDEPRAKRNKSGHSQLSEAEEARLAAIRAAHLPDLGRAEDLADLYCSHLRPKQRPGASVTAPAAEASATVREESSGH